MSLRNQLWSVGSQAHWETRGGAELPGWKPGGWANSHITSPICQCALAFMKGLPFEEDKARHILRILLSLNVMLSLTFQTLSMCDTERCYSAWNTKPMHFTHVFHVTALHGRPGAIRYRMVCEMPKKAASQWGREALKGARSGLWGVSGWEREGGWQG